MQIVEVVTQEKQSGVIQQQGSRRQIIRMAG
jgi:hypothetical protein